MSQLTRAAHWSALMLLASAALFPLYAVAQSQATNPILYADVPDVALLRVGDDYYMSSTTMHMTPGVPIMRSKNLVDWNLIGYAYDVLERNDALELQDGKNAYGAGSWASSLRYRDGVFYLATFSGTTGKTYIYSTRDPSGKWDCKSFEPMCHDCSLFFDDDGRAYLFYGSGDIRLTELADDLSGFKPGGVNLVAIKNASAAAGSNIGLPAEGTQVFKRNGKYYVCNIVWPRNDMRMEIVHRADSIEGPYEGRVFIRNRGIAQGTIFEGTDGEWFALFFRDSGAVGRIPYLLKVEWRDDWPVPADNGKFPDTLPIVHDADASPLGNIIGNDEFSDPDALADYASAGPWQWNHNPDPDGWSLKARPGWLRLAPQRLDSVVTQARNTLTQRTFGPTSSGATALDPRGLKDGDVAGILLLQRRYGYVGVTRRNGKLHVVQAQANERDELVENDAVPLEGEPTSIQLRAKCDFRERRDLAQFEWSRDGKIWEPIGTPLQMFYTLPHFMGYRFGLFCQATQTIGGVADFDYFHIER
ncbi:MAG: glycoside hydrolase 43 family protein [Thermoguttaceae bacterium]|jgi:beta-xylosidase